MLRKSRKALLLVAIAMATAGSATAARDESKAAVHGEGTSLGSGVTKNFLFQAVQKSPTTFLAHGGAYLEQIDPTGAYGDFTIEGKVSCMRLAGTHATIGIIITAGTGTAAGREGEAFYLVADDNSDIGVADQFDNSGYTGTPVADCNYDQGTAAVVIDGDIRVRQDN